MSELSRLRGSEGYGVCDDEISVFQAAEWETRGRLFYEIVPEAPGGVHNILTMKVGPKDLAEAGKGVCRAVFAA